MQEEDEARRKASPHGSPRGSPHGSPRGDAPGEAAARPRARFGRAPASSPPASSPPAAEAPWRADLGLRPVAALLPRVSRPAFRRRSPAAAHLMSDWPQIVGPVLAAQTMPQRLVGGTLTLGCSGPVAMELQHLGPQLIAKVNGALGQRVVERLRFVQSAMPAAPRRAPRPAPAALPEPVSRALDSVEDPELRAALARLGRGVYRRATGS